MNIKIIIIILIIITIIISSIIIYAVKKDEGIDSFFITDKSSGYNLSSGITGIPALQQTEYTDIRAVLKLKNPLKNEKYKLVIYHISDSEKLIIQTSIIPIEKEISQIIEIPIIKKGHFYQKGKYLVTLYHNDIVAREAEFEIK